MPHRARAAINVAIETAAENLLRDLTAIKHEYGLTDEQMAERLRLQASPAVAAWWREWVVRKEPLTQQIPIINHNHIAEESVGDINDL